MHELDGRAPGEVFGEIVPARRLFGAEIGTIEDFLKANYLAAVASRFTNHRLVFVGHDLTNLLKRTGGWLR